MTLVADEIEQYLRGEQRLTPSKGGRNTTPAGNTVGHTATLSVQVVTESCRLQRNLDAGWVLQRAFDRTGLEDGIHCVQQPCPHRLEGYAYMYQSSADA